MVLSQFITDDNMNSLVVPFTKMIDEMTPYYQERIRWLAPQQRKIVEFLCMRERPITVKELAKRLLRTGIDFLKTGGTDRGILLDLNQEERKILEQALGLE